MTIAVALQLVACSAPSQPIQAQYAPPIEYEPVPPHKMEAEYEEPISPPPSSQQTMPPLPQASSANLALYGIISRYKDGLFLIAHPSCELANCQPLISVQNMGDAVVEDISWSGGFSGKQYRTLIKFKPFYNNGMISSIAIDAEDENNPFVPAFVGAEKGKSIALKLLSAWIKGKTNSKIGTSADIAIQLADTTVPVKQMISLALVHLMN